MRKSKSDAQKQKSDKQKLVRKFVTEILKSKALTEYWKKKYYAVQTELIEAQTERIREQNKKLKEEIAKIREATNDTIKRTERELKMMLNKLSVHFSEIRPQLQIPEDVRNWRKRITEFQLFGDWVRRGERVGRIDSLADLLEYQECGSSNFFEIASADYGEKNN
jgi:hypothetical protein